MKQHSDGSITLEAGERDLLLKAIRLLVGQVKELHYLGERLEHGADEAEVDDICRRVEVRNKLLDLTLPMGLEILGCRLPTPSEMD
jgi:hypothetical protein